MAATKHIQTEGTGAPYRVPPEPKRWPAIGMAVGVHALLIAFLVIGVNWQNHEPIAVEAEVWDVKTQTAAPPPPQPAPQPEPEPDTPPPPPQPAPKAVEPPPPVEQPQVKQPKAPDIALEREKKHKEELKRKQQLEEERQEHERELADQKRADEKKAKALADRKEREQAEKKERELEQKQQAEQKAREEADKKAQAQEQARKDAAEKKKAEKEKAEKLAKDKAEKARLEKARAEEMKRMMSAAGNTGSTGTAEKSTAPHRDNGYIAAITAIVKGNAHYGGSLDEPGNPTATFHVEQLPTGEIISVRKTRSSGVPAFDDAVEKAIKASSPLPKKKDGTVERSLEINFHMKDMQ